MRLCHFLRTLLFIPAVFLLSCETPVDPARNNTTTGVSDNPIDYRSDPVPLYPKYGATVRTASVPLRWSSGSGGPYDLAISLDSLFTRMVFEGTLADTTRILRLEQCGMYWWKVRRSGGSWSSLSVIGSLQPAFGIFFSTVSLYDLPLQLVCRRTRNYPGGEKEVRTTLEELSFDVGYFDVLLGHRGGYRYDNDYLATNGFHRIVSFTADVLREAIGPIEMLYRYPTGGGTTSRVQEARICFKTDLGYISGKQTVRYTGKDARDCVEILSFRDSSYTREGDGGYTTLVKTLAEVGTSSATSLTVYVNSPR